MSSATLSYAGLSHLLLATGLLIGAGVFTETGANVSMLLHAAPARPDMIVTHGQRDAQCAAKSLETIVGTFGCAGTRRAAHLANITFVSFSR